MGLFDGGGQNAPSGGAHMFGAALKMIGLEPGVIEQLSHSLLVDIKAIARNQDTIAGHQAELLARLEHLMRCTPALDEAAQESAWGEYLFLRRKEFEGQIALLKKEADHNAGTGNHSDGGATGGADAHG